MSAADRKEARIRALPWVIFAATFGLIEWVTHYQIPIVLVLTKADKLSRTKQRKQAQIAARTLDIPDRELILFSAKSRLGKEALWERIAQAIKINEGGKAIRT